MLFQVLLNARLPQWPDFGKQVTVSPDQGGCQTSHERRSHILLRTNHSAACWNQKKNTPTFNFSCFFFALKWLNHLPFTTRCAYMCECDEYACVQPVQHEMKNVMYAYENVCAYILSSSVFNPAGTNWEQPFREVFGCQNRIFSSLESRN